MHRSLPDPLIAGRFLQSAEISELRETLTACDYTRQSASRPPRDVDWFDLFDDTSPFRQK